VRVASREELNAEAGFVELAAFEAWFLKESGHSRSIFYQSAGGQAETTVAELSGMIESGAISLTTSVWRDGMDAWAPLGELGLELETETESEPGPKPEPQPGPEPEPEPEPAGACAHLTSAIP